MPKIALPGEIQWTYGMELECADWDTRKGWEGFGRDPEPQIVNSSGVAADPTLKSYPFGGEVTTEPTATIDEQIGMLKKFRKLHPMATVTYRGALHVHIRVPGLSKNLTGLKKVQRCLRKCRREDENLFGRLYFQENKLDKDEEGYAEWRRWANNAVQAATFILPDYRIQNQLDAKTVKEFMEAEVPVSKKGAILWHAQRRSTVNLRQLKQTDTVEFRHAHCTFDANRVYNFMAWCRDFMLCAFDGGCPWEMYDELYKAEPLCHNSDPYCPYMEARYRATNFLGKNKRIDIESAIQAIMEEEFDDGPTVPNHLRWEN